jgi:diguanylate cyclase (GGDEF)-like protein/PAS domain S-box-containing protein
MTNSDDFYRELLDNLYDGVYFVDRERTITYWSKGAERITGYAAAEVIGRNCSDNLLVHIDEEARSLCHGRCPLAESLRDGCLHKKDVYLLHKDGHRVPILVRVAPIRGPEGNITGAVEIFTDSAGRGEMAQRLAEFEKMAYLDTLTELMNRRYTEIALASRHEEMERYGWPFGVIFLDIDDFKKINDRYGHDVGDDVLKMVARTVAHSARSFDVVGRWGGEEFIAVVANVDRDELVHMAKRFRSLVEQSRLHGEEPVKVTISLGAAHARAGESVAGLLKRADRHMYESKKAGKNCVTTDAE